MTTADEPTPTTDDPITALVALDDTLVRNTVEEVKAIAHRAHRVEIALVATAAILMVMVAGFTGWNTYRLREVNSNLTTLVESIEANQIALQTYNEAHAKATAESHRALAHNLSCMSEYFQMTATAMRDRTAIPDKATLDACFALTEPAPPDLAPIPNGKKRGGNS